MLRLQQAATGSLHPHRCRRPPAAGRRRALHTRARPPRSQPDPARPPVLRSLSSQLSVISNVRSAALLERDAPNREETMAAVRKEINDWVARYRR